MKRESGKAAGLIAKIIVAWAWIRPSQRARKRGPDTFSSEPGNSPMFSAAGSLLILIFVSLAFVAWGFFAYSTIGVKWPPPWNFGVVEDLPGASVYSTNVGTRFGAEPEQFQAEPEVQHVREKSRPASPPPGK